MRSRTTWLIAGAALALSGCDLAPHYQAPLLPVPAQLPGADPTIGAGAPADVAWHDFFTDPRLRQLVDIALANNRDLRVAVANVAQSRAQSAEARANLFPTIAGNAAASFSRQSQAELFSPAEPRRTDSYQASIGISSWEVDVFGRLRNLSKEAFETYLASRDARDAAQVLLISEVADDYLTLAADQDQLRLSIITADADARLLGLTQTMLRIGTATGLDVAQAQTSYDSARAQVATGTTRVAQDRNALALVLGAPVPDALLPATLPQQGATIADLPVGLSSDVLLRRPDIIEAEHRLRAADADIGAARAAFFPAISLTAALGTLSTGLTGLFAGGNGTWNATPSLTAPIFDFGKNQANLRYSRASRDVAVAQYEKAIQTGFREVADALAQRGTIGAQLSAQSSLERAAATSLNLSNMRYSTGVDTFLSVLDAQRTLYAAQQNLITTRLTQQTNMVELYRALGGGLR